MTWAYDPATDMFARDHGKHQQRIRRSNLPCTDGDLIAGVMGTKHDWDSWGTATTTAGTFARDVEMFVCKNPDCMRTKYGPTICRN